MIPTRKQLKNARRCQNNLEKAKWQLLNIRKQFTKAAECSPYNFSDLKESADALYCKILHKVDDIKLAEFEK